MKVDSIQDMQPAPPINTYIERTQKNKQAQVIIDIENLFDDIKLTKTHVQKMADAKFIYPNLVVQGHVSAYAATANGGKSAIFRFVAGKLSADGFIVIYINVDASPSDLKKHFYHAEAHKYTVIAPDAIQGKSVNDIIKKLSDIAKSDTDASKYVFILDTLKKFVDVIEKKKAKTFYALLRQLSVRGATINLLCHCNKYKDDAGQSLYEGTADLRNDIDDLIYLDNYLNESRNVLEVTTRPDKVRANYHPISFEIDKNEGKNLAVTQVNRLIRILPDEDKMIVDLIKYAILDGNEKQKDIVDYVKEKRNAEGGSKIGDKKIINTLKFYSKGNNPEFVMDKTGFAKTLSYRLREEEHNG